MRMDLSSGFVGTSMATSQQSAMEADMGLALKAVAELAQLNKTQVAPSVDATFSVLWKQLMEQARWTKAQVAKDLKVSVTRADSSIDSEVARHVATLSSRLSAVEVVGSREGPSSRLKNRNKTSEGCVGKSAESGDGLCNVGGSSSRYFC